MRAACSDVLIKSTIALLLSVSCVSAFASEAQWAWVSSRSGVNSWDTHHGTAEVTLGHGAFHARLQDPSDGSRFYDIDGTLKDGRIVAKVTVKDADIGPIAVTGAYKMQPWSGVKGFRETIVLSSGFEMFGLTRDGK